MLDQPTTLAEVDHVVTAIENNKSAGSDGIVRSNPTREMPLTLFTLAWSNKFAPNYEREGLQVSLFQKGDGENPGNPTEFGRQAVQ